MGYWRDKYPERVGDLDFVDGIMAAMDTYAVWKDGALFIGSMRMPLEKAIAEVKSDLEYVEGDITAQSE